MNSLDLHGGALDENLPASAGDYTQYSVMTKRGYVYTYIKADSLFYTAEINTIL